MEKVLTKLKSFKLKSPEEVFKSLSQWFDENKKMAFFMALIIGFITHAILLSVMIMSPDGLWNSLHYSAGQVETESGRWAINLIDTFRKDLAVPTITTVFSIIVTAVNAIFIVDLLNLKSKISSAITGIFLAVSPCFAMTLLYSYTADAYAFSFLFATLAAWCIYREKNKVLGGIFGAIFTMLVLALYQSYIGVIIGLCILKPIIEILESKKEYKQIFINIGISILVVAVGIGLYWVSEQIALKIYDTELSSYGGANNIGIVTTIKNLPTTFFAAYASFWDFFFGNDVVSNSNMSRTSFYNILFIAEIITFILILIFRETESKKKKIIDAILILAMTLVLPLGLNIIVLIAPNTIFYTLNSSQMLLVIPFMMVILEKFKFERGVILKWISLAMCFIIAVTYYLGANVSYLGVRLKYNQAYALTLRLVDRIENCEGYAPEKQWLIVGIIDEKNTTPVTDIYFLTLDEIANGPIFHGNYWGSRETWKKFLQIFMGIQPNFCSVEDYFKICGTREFKDMPIFPNPGSVREINGVMVVKFTHNVPME